MKRSKKVFLVLSSAVLLVCISVGATIAYLTAQDEVTNTFTVGSVAITLDEAPVDADGKEIDGDGVQRVHENEYKLLPGHEYDKDPTIHFAAHSEASYLFVQVVNGISDIESHATDYISIEEQIEGYDWLALTGVPNVYYKAVLAAGDVDVDYPVFDRFVIDGQVENDDLADYDESTIIVTAYAVQKDGFDSAAAAWEATFGASTEP